MQGVLLSASWELDVWGRVRYGQAAAVAQHAATQADFEYARQSLAASVARSWFLAIEARQQIALSASAVADGEWLSLAGDRERVGSGDSYVAVASANLEIYRDALLQANLGMHRRCARSKRCSALSGGSARGATELTCVICGAARRSRGAAGTASRRRAAERRIAAAFNRVEESKVALLPHCATAG